MEICQVSQIFDVWHTALARVVTLQNVSFFPVRTTPFTLSLAAPDIRHRGNSVGSQLSAQQCRNTTGKKKKCRTINFFGLVGFEAPVSWWKIVIRNHWKVFEGNQATHTDLSNNGKNNLEMLKQTKYTSVVRNNSGNFWATNKAMHVSICMKVGRKKNPHVIQVILLYGCNEHRGKDDLFHCSSV